MGHTDGIERLDDPRPARETSHNLAGTDTAKVGKNQLGTGLGEGVGGVNDNATVPLGQAARKAALTLFHGTASST
jgi:hypothetical protein